MTPKQTAERLREALLPLHKELSGQVEDDGGCDHSVGICRCSTIENLLNARAALEAETMTDLKRLRKWSLNQAPFCLCGVDSDNHRETARILSVLERVREGCLIEYPAIANPAYETGPALSTSLTIDGPPDDLRALAELLGRE